jgi:hypothetical protein
MGEVMNIIELAKQAGLRTYQEQAPGIDGVFGNWEDLEAFAALVEAAARAEERDSIAQMYEGAFPSMHEQNDMGGCLVCGFTPKLAMETIRARGTT